MISRLHISNYILIEELDLEFGPGLHIVTGETGAGKSILMDALSLLAGERADPRCLRNPERKCVVEAVFRGEFSSLLALLEEAGIEPEDEPILRREILPGGKSRAFVNDSPVTLEVLRQVGSRLFDIHGQQDTRGLGRPENQMEMLDWISGSRAPRLAYEEAYRLWCKLESEWKQLSEMREKDSAERAFREFVRDELTGARLREGEQEELEKRSELLRHAGEIRQKLHQVSEGLDGEGDMTGQLKTLSHTLEKVSGQMPGMEETATRLKSCFLELRDIAGEIRQAAGALNPDPEELQRAEERLSVLYGLQKKHRRQSEEALLAYLGQLEDQLAEEENGGEKQTRLREEADAAKAKTIQLGEALRGSRTAGIAKTESEIMETLAVLGMPRARFQVRLEPATQPGPDGLDRVNFLFSANPGVAPAELRLVASGGEFSRLMLAFKCLLAGSNRLPTLIFDEIDTGISGAVALQVGRLIHKLARQHQVMAITHSPQLASRADQHWFIYKTQEGNQTRTHVKALGEKEQIEALAAMMGGGKPSEASMEAARELKAS